MRRYTSALIVLLSLILVAGAGVSASVSAPTLVAGRSAAAPVIEVAQNATAAVEAIQNADGEFVGVSEPEFGVTVARDVMIPMRDDVALAADIYFPAEDGEALAGPWPVVLERTPYGKTGSRLVNQAEYFAERGYVFVVQDVRGRYDSEGTFYIYTQEVDDGYDTILWINDQPWSDERIGLTGGSYTAATAYAILVQDPPGLAAAFIREGSSNYHEDGGWQGGAFELSHNVGYALSLAAVGKEASADAAVEEGLNWARETEQFADELQMFPLGLGASVFAIAPSYDVWYQDWQDNELYDEYWKQNGYNVEEHYDEIADVPVLLLGAWYDRFHRGTINNFLGLTQNNDSPVALFVIPQIHGPGGVEITHAGDVEFGADAAVNTAKSGSRMMELNLWWFDKWLKDLDSGVPEGDFVRIFRMESGDGSQNASGRLQAGGEWLELDTWPPDDVEYTEFYLTLDMGLQAEIPEEGAITYMYDPADPVPTVGGNMTSGGDVAPGGPYDQRCREELPLCTNTLPLNTRADVLSFTTPPLTEDVEVTGPITVRLWASSSAVDTDFTAKLIDVYPPSPDYPDGFAMNLADSIVRARFRDFEQVGPEYHRAYAIKEEPLEPGEVYEITIDLWTTSNLFHAGHRVRLDISSSNFPRFDANPNTGEPFAGRHLPPVAAENTIYTGAEQASHILLPIRSTAEGTAQKIDLGYTWTTLN